MFYKKSILGMKFLAKCRFTLCKVINFYLEGGCFAWDLGFDSIFSLFDFYGYNAGNGVF